MAASLRAYMGRHWRGENSLAYAFCFNYVVAVLIVHGFLEGLSFAGPGTLTAGVAVILVIFLYPLALAWSAVGAWRSAATSIADARAARPRQSAFWGYAAKVLIIYISLVTFLDLLV